MAENRFVKPPLFNPWKDFAFTPLSNQTDAAGTGTHRHSNDYYYSSHTCVAAATTKHRKDHVSRTCHYRNLYYHISSKTWHYFPNPSEHRVFHSDRTRLDEMNVTVWHVREHSTDWAVQAHSEPYRPEVHLTDATPASHKVQLLSTNNGMRPVFVIYKGSMPNYGHFIWDDYLSIYSQLDLLDLADDDTLMPIPFVHDPLKYAGGSWCSSDNQHVFEKCASFMKRLYPALWNLDTDCTGDVLRTDNWLQGPTAIGRWDQHPHSPCGDYRDDITNTIPGPGDTDYVLVPNVTVGSGRLALFSCYGDCTLGRGPQLFRFRNFLLRRMLGHDHTTNPKGYITFSLAHGASRGKGEVTLFDDEIAAARERYGTDAVKAVDLASMPLEEQASLIANSAVLFTNHGGGSASTVFLPKGSSAFVYWRGQQRDNEFYRSVAYFRTEWIEYHARQDVARTMRLLEMQLLKTAIQYPNMICFARDKLVTAKGSHDLMSDLSANMFHQ